MARIPPQQPWGPGTKPTFRSEECVVAAESECLLTDYVGGHLHLFLTRVVDGRTTTDHELSRDGRWMHTRDGWKEHELTDGMIETFLEYGKSIPPGTEIAIPHFGGAMNKRPVDAIATAIQNRTVRGSVLITHVGRTNERDALPQADDYLDTLEGVDTAIVFGMLAEAIHISARSTDARVHIAAALHEAFADVGSAGGHREMAGGEVPLGIFADYTSDDTLLLAIVDQAITTRLVAGLNLTDEPDDQSSQSAAEPDS